MKVKELKEIIDKVDENDDVHIMFPDMGAGGYTTTKQVAVVGHREDASNNEIELFHKGTGLTIVADLL